MNVYTRKCAARERIFSCSAHRALLSSSSASLMKYLYLLNKHPASNPVRAPFTKTVYKHDEDNNNITIIFLITLSSVNRFLSIT